MESNSIKNKERLRQLNSGEAFSCEVPTYDRQCKKGGDLQYYAECKVSKPLTVLLSRPML